MKYLKFEADWCGICKMIKPQLRKVSEAGITVEAVNAEYNAELVTEYSVKNLPTVILVDDSGKEYYRTGGSKIKSTELIETYNNFANG